MATGDSFETRRVARPGILKKTAIVLGLALLLLVLLLEIGSRVADRVVDGNPSPPALFQKIALTTLDPSRAKDVQSRTMPHPYLSFCLRPSYRTLPGSDHQCSHNALGFRGKETTWEKPPGVFRVVTMGGSSVYGQSESSDEAVWSARLEKILAAERPNARIEVINAGVSGYTSYEMLIELELFVMDLHPDLIVLYESVNDMRSALYTKGFPVPKRDDTHWRAIWPVDRPPSPIERVLEKSRTYLVWRAYGTDYLRKRADLFYTTLVDYDGHENARLYCGGEKGYPDGKVPDEGFVFYRRNLENIVSIAQAGGAQVLIATQALMMWDMPQRECADIQVASFRRIQDLQREVARERGIALAETGREIEAEEDRIFKATGKHVFKNDVHPFDEGSAIIARKVADALLASGLLP
jgi:lysophospholipase L1-like esterase